MRLRALMIVAAATIALAGSILAPRPAAACLSFDFDAELAAVDGALANAQLSPQETAEITALRNKAVEIDRQLTRLSEELSKTQSKRNLTVLRALEKLGLKPVVLPNEASQGEEPGAVPLLCD